MIPPVIPFAHNDILNALRGCGQAFRTVGMFSAIINFLMLAPSLYMLQVYDRVLPSGNEFTLLMLTAMVLALFGLLAGLELVRSFIVIRLGARLDIELSRRVYSASFQDNLKTGNQSAGQALNDLTTLRQFVTGSALFALFDAPWFPIYLLVIFLFNPWLGLFALLGSALLAALAYLNERICAPPLQEASRIAVASTQLASANLRNAEVIEALGMLSKLMARWFGLHSHMLAHQGLASERAAIMAALTKFVRLALQSLMLGVAALLVVENKLSPGMMIAGSILLGRTLAPLEQWITVSRQLNGVKLAYGRLVELLDANPRRSVGMSLPVPAGRILVEHVVAAPPRVGKAVLQGVSFALEPGDALGIVGPSGCGKSTLARVLVGIWPAASGKVRLDGADIYQWEKEELGPHIGYLPQDIALFGGTISENIARYGDVAPEKVIRAAQLAGVHELVLRLPRGYDTEIGEAGSALSGGQRQRIALARALYGDPALVVLDEPNSNLDDAGEHALAQAILLLRGTGKTVVLITHRPNVLGTTNKILMLTDGRVHLFGPREQVIQRIADQRKAADATTPAPAAHIATIRSEAAEATG